MAENKDRTFQITNELLSNTEKIVAYQKVLEACIKKGMSKQEATKHARHEVLHAIADTNGPGFFTLMTENDEITATGYQPIGSRTNDQINTIAKAPGNDMSHTDLSRTNKPKQ